MKNFSEDNGKINDQYHNCPPLIFHTITHFNLVVPTCSVFWETGVVHRITYSFSYFLLLIVLFIHFILDIKKGMLYQFKQLNHILLK
jgi:hypothetical protein